MKKLIFFGTLLLTISAVSTCFAQNETPSFLPELTGQVLYEQGLNLSSGRLVRMEGKVNFRSSSKEDWKPATLQMAVGAGQWLQTAKGAEAILSFGKEVVITLNEDVTMEVKEVELKPDGTVKVKINLIRGKIWSLVERLKVEKSRYEIETPTAIAGVRGTTFMVNVEPDGQSSQIGVVKGEVWVCSIGEKPAYVILKEKMATTVVYNKPPTPPQVLEAKEIMEWQKWEKAIPFSEIGIIKKRVEMHAWQMEEAAKLIRQVGFTTKASQKAIEDFKIFEAALHQYYQDTGGFPTREQGGLKALLKNPRAKGWNGPYVDPASNFMDPYGRPYSYRIKKTEEGNVYLEIFSMGLERAVGDVLPPKKEGKDSSVVEYDK